MNNSQGSDNPLFIHVGLHKTGSTFLQRDVFPKLKAVRFLHGLETIDWLTRLSNEQDFSFEPDNYLRHFGPPMEKGPCLISSEGLSGNVFQLYMNQTRTADRMALLFPHATILLCIRRQDMLLFSLYGQCIEQGDITSLTKFLGYAGGEFQYSYSPLGRHVNLPMFFYDRLVNLYSSRFGGRVEVLLYEELRADAEEYVSKVCGKIGEPKAPSIRNTVRNRGYGYYQTQVSRVFNRFFRSPANRYGLVPDVYIPHFGRLTLRKVLQSPLVEPWLGAKPIWSEEIAGAIRRYFRPCNATLENSLGLGLDKWGYLDG